MVWPKNTKRSWRPSLELERNPKPNSSKGSNRWRASSAARESGFNLANLHRVRRARSERGGRRMYETAGAAEDYRLSTTFAAKRADTRPSFSSEQYWHVEIYALRQVQ